MKKIAAAILSIVVFSVSGFSQTVEAYDDNEEGLNLFDPSRLDISQSASFGMSSSDASGLNSQSLYSTMLTYKFSKPVTVNFSFGLPIHSTYSNEMNLNSENIESADYFKTMPMSASLHWQPSDKFRMSLSVSKGSYNSYNPFFHNTGFSSPYRSYNNPEDKDTDKSDGSDTEEKTGSSDQKESK